MQHTRFLRRVLATATLGLAAACHDTAAPSQPNPTVPFDARHALAKFEPVAVVLDQPIFRSFNGALSFFEMFFRSTVSASITPVASRGVFSMNAVRNLATLASIRASAIPDDAKGKTFVYDFGSRSYIIDATATGAPANGARFVLYSWDETTGAPAVPLTRVGYVDIFPAEGSAGSPEQTELFILRDTPRLPIADFVVMHGTDAGVNVFGIEGSATDGITEDLIELNGTESGAAGQRHSVLNTTLSSSPAGVSASEQLSSDQPTGSQGGKLELSYEGHTLTDEHFAAANEVRFDGNLYARIVFPQTVDQQTQYLKPDGTPLTPQDATDLEDVILRAVAANFFWISLALP